MATMRCITVEPGTKDSLRLEEFRIPTAERGAVLIRAVALGVCGTDGDIIAAKYGEAPAGHKRLIIGHESLGRVVEAAGESGLSKGDLVVAIVRHPDPAPCPNCARGEWDMCSNGRYTEHGIKALDGFGSELYRVDPEFVVRVPESLGLHGVLVEPTSVVAKAWRHTEAIGGRAYWEPRRLLVTGAGPVGLIAALLGVQRGLEVDILNRSADETKMRLTRALGARFVEGEIDDVDDEYDVIMECTGSGTVAMRSIERAAPNGVVCLLSVSAPGEKVEIDAGKTNYDIVIGNRVVFGSVNANRADYEAAVSALERADASWLDGLITRRVPLEDWQSAFEKRPGDVKTVILFPDER
jgi:threonine dehydrogenase-like Zn-dependent dehydrogenase